MYQDNIWGLFGSLEVHYPAEVQKCFTNKILDYDRTEMIWGL